MKDNSIYFSEARKWSCVRLAEREEDKTGGYVVCLHNKCAKTIVLTLNNDIWDWTKPQRVDKTKVDLLLATELSVFLINVVNCSMCKSPLVLFWKLGAEVVLGPAAFETDWERDVARMYLCCCSRYENH